VPACQGDHKGAPLRRGGGYFQTSWLKEKAKPLPQVPETLAPVHRGAVLNLDELWSFMYSKANQRWVWIALCRRTRQIVAFFIGDRSEASCRELWGRIPKAYRGGHTCSDFWDAYQVDP
jgi:insertion element IS1 protein InsB